MFADSSASQDLLMRRRELKDRACKDKARSDSGFYRASSSSSASSLLPNKLSLERTSKSQVVIAYSNSKVALVLCLAVALMLNLLC